MARRRRPSLSIAAPGRPCLSLFFCLLSRLMGSIYPPAQVHGVAGDDQIHYGSFIVCASNDKQAPDSVKQTMSSNLRPQAMIALALGCLPCQEGLCASSNSRVGGLGMFHSVVVFPAGRVL